MTEVDIAAKVMSYRQTGVCDDPKLAKLCDENPAAPRYTVARLFLSKPKKKAPAKKKKVAKKK